jgi:hypothetical protein
MFRLRSLAISIVALMSSACITFQEQSISYRYDVDSDRLLVHSIYAGIYGDGLFGSPEEDDPYGLTGDEEDELVWAASGQQMFFFDNWSQVLDLDEARRQLANPAGAVVSQRDRAADQARRELLRALADNVTMSKGPFYLDSAGRLCAVQRMTVRNLSAVIKVLNASWQPYVRSVAVEDPDWASRAITIDSVLAFTGNQLVVRYPGWAEDPGTIPGDVSRVFNEAGIVTLVVGRPDAARVTVTRTMETRYLPNAVGFVRQRFGIATRFDPALDAARFFTGTGR